MLDSLSLSQLQLPLKALSLQGDARFDRVSTDTRSLQPGDLFVALSGPNFDGNRFVAEAARRGAAGAIVTEIQPLELPQLQVTDGRRALGDLAAFDRSRFGGQLVAVTGSSGKTSVKEMLAAILSTQGKIHATRGNLNNEIGVPLTLLELQPEHRFAVIELGASGAGEIAYTSGLARPDVAILTNAGGAHLEGFGSLEGVVKAKGEIFQGLGDRGTGIVNLDDPHSDYWLQLLKERGRLTFSMLSPQGDLFASHLEPQANGCYRFLLNTHEGQIPVTLGVMGKHMVANALAAAAAARALGLDLEQIRQGLAAFSGVPGRLAVSQRRDGVRVIDDSYNANPQSVKAAIGVLADLPGERVLVLGNMAELGSDSLALHADVGAFAAANGVHWLLTSGQLASQAAQAFSDAGGSARSFENNDQLSEWLVQHMTPEMVVLVKGSRSAGMEAVVKALLVEENC